MSTGLPRPGLARSAHRGRIKLLRGYVSKSSAALNPLTITQLACELSVRGRSRTALHAWPIPSIGGTHAHYAYNSTAHAYTCIACVHMYRMRIANALRRGPLIDVMLC